MAPRYDLTELGTTGLKRSTGFVFDEFLTRLRGIQGVKTYREMSDNDPVIGAILYAIEKVITRLEWRVDPYRDQTADGEPDQVDVETAEFVESCLNDMSDSWDSTLSQILSMCIYGWSFHEIVYKVRGGPEQKDPAKRSKFNDGRVGWRKWAIRSQETLWLWKFGDDGGIEGMYQVDPYSGHGRVEIPIEKALLFRTTATKNNPEGRALDPATPIPTPDGWRAMGELAVGDRVFDERGCVRHVVARADWSDRPRYRLTFADGTSIVADGNHQWMTQKLWERSTGREATTRTTEEIAATVRNSNGVANHSIRLAGPLQHVAQRLLVDPYVLGMWLGDGDSNGARITCHADDLVEQMAAVEARGYEVTKMGENSPPGSLGRYFRIGSGLQASLRTIGVIGDKHIPAEYLMGSIEQRRALLAGLLDTDGHVDSYGRVEFVNVNRRIIDGVAELVRSLGMVPRVSRRRHAGIDSRGMRRSEAWAVRFTPTDPVFTLERKNALIKGDRARNLHYIVSADRIEDGDTVCIEVDSPSHLFLAGEAMVPTHNSLLRNAFRPWWFKRRIEEIEAIGIERDLAGLPVAMVPPEYLSATPTPEQVAVLTAIQQIVTSIKRNENEGIIFPMVYDEGGHALFELKLLSSGGTRQFDIDKTLTRLDQRIAMSLVSDFLLLGTERVGSFALGATKMDLWSMAVDSIAKTIADTVNQHAVPRLLRLNGLDITRPPVLVYSEVAHVDLAEVSDFVSKLTQAGVMAPDPGLEDHLRDLAGLPPANHDMQGTGTGQMSEDDMKAVLALPPQQRIVAQRTGVVPDKPAFPGASAPFGGGKKKQAPGGQVDGTDGTDGTDAPEE